MKVKIAFLVLALSVLACGQYVTPVPEIANTETATYLPPTQTAIVPTSTPRSIGTDEQTAIVVQGFVNVRSEPDGPVIGFVKSGDTVNVLECTELWCKIETPPGYVWRGCLSDNPYELKCETK